MIAWGALPLVLGAGALTAWHIWMTRFEQRTGSAFRFFAIYEPWSRARNPKLFKLRQVANYLMVAFLAVATLSFLILFLGLLHA